MVQVGHIDGEKDEQDAAAAAAINCYARLPIKSK